MAAEVNDWLAWMRELGLRVRRARDVVGLSQERLAQLAGVSQGAISRMETGAHLCIPLLVVVRIGNALARCLQDLDAADLSDELRHITKTPSIVAAGAKQMQLMRDQGLDRLLDVYRRLPARSRERVIAHCRATAAALSYEDPDHPK